MRSLFYKYEIAINRSIKIEAVVRYILFCYASSTKVNMHLNISRMSTYIHAPHLHKPQSADDFSGAKLWGLGDKATRSALSLKAVSLYSMSLFINHLMNQSRPPLSRQNQRGTRTRDDPSELFHHYRCLISTTAPPPSWLEPHCPPLFVKSSWITWEGNAIKIAECALNLFSLLTN